MKQEENKAQALRRAYELAGSGEHIDYLTIEDQLAREGYLEARDWLDREGLRQTLKEICDRSRKGRTSA
jgi:hypothetical protein